MTSRISLACMAALLLVASPVLAGYSNFSAGPGLGVAVPDDAYNGTLGSMASHSIGVAGQPAIIDDVNVTISMSHTWIGDLTIKLLSPGGTMVTLLNRPGLVVADNGTSCCGRSDNLTFALPITYDDAATLSAEAMGLNSTANNVGDGAVGTADGSIFQSAPDGAQAGHNNMLTALNGSNPNGTWTLYIGDSASGDLGTLNGWTLSISAVPEPATIALLGLGALAMIRRRR